MKAAPVAVLGAAVLAGWVSSPAVAFSARSSADRALEQASCATSFIDQVAAVRLAPAAPAAPHAHSATCTCAACVAKAGSTE